MQRRKSILAVSLSLWHCTAEHEKLSPANSADDDDARAEDGASLSYPHSSEAHLNREEREGGREGGRKKTFYIVFRRRRRIMNGFNGKTTMVSG